MSNQYQRSDDRCKSILDEARSQYERDVNSVPEKYRRFVMNIERNQRVSKDQWIKIPNAYMRVDGRILMAQDDHREKGEKIDIRTHVVETGVGVVIECEVESTLYGKYKDRASINIGGSGVDATNPIENATTSAVGRALALMGYGLLGSGLASADEVEDAIQRRENDTTEPHPARTPTDKQIKYLRDLLDKTKMSFEEKEGIIDDCKTTQQASQIIEYYSQDPWGETEELAATRKERAFNGLASLGYSGKKATERIESVANREEASQLLEEIDSRIAKATQGLVDDTERIGTSEPDDALAWLEVFEALEAAGINREDFTLYIEDEYQKDIQELGDKVIQRYQSVTSKPDTLDRLVTSIKNWMGKQFPT